MANPLQDGDPSQIGPYTLLERLGAGGMGVVYLGRSPGGRLVAVKTVRSELAEDAGFRRRFTTEVQAARMVGGFYTAHVVEADTEGSPPWLATAYIPGPTLHQTVKEHGPLPTGSVAVLGLGLAEGLAAVHGKGGVVHRDLKPANVILAEDGPRLIDFGIARAMDATSYTQTRTVLGTAAFMSPEQARAEEIGPPSDVFSLGCVLTFAITGASPFGAGPSHAVTYRIVHESPDLTGLPEELADVVAACLAKDPNTRPSPRQVLEDVSALADDTSADSEGAWLPNAVTEIITQRKTKVLQLTKTGTKTKRQAPPPRTPESETPKKSTTPQQPRTRTGVHWGTKASHFRRRYNSPITCDLPPGGNKTDGKVWGDGVYTDDSSVGLAAVHAGLITLEDGGRVTFEKQPGRTSYTSATRNGIASSQRGICTGSFVFPNQVRSAETKPAKAETPDKSDDNNGTGWWIAVVATIVTALLYVNYPPFAAFVSVVLNADGYDVSAGDCVGNLATDGTVKWATVPCFAANAEYTVLGRASLYRDEPTEAETRIMCSNAPGWNGTTGTTLDLSSDTVCVEER